jgi:hypothetical protein
VSEGGERHGVQDHCVSEWTSSVDRRHVDRDVRKHPDHGRHDAAAQESLRTRISTCQRADPGRSGRPGVNNLNLMGYRT